MPIVRKAIEQRQEAKARIANMNKTLGKIDNSLSEEYEEDNYNNNELQNS